MDWIWELGSLELLQYGAGGSCSLTTLGYPSPVRRMQKLWQVGINSATLAAKIGRHGGGGGQLSAAGTSPQWMKRLPRTMQHDSAPK